MSFEYAIRSKFTVGKSRLVANHMPQLALFRICKDLSEFRFAVPANVLNLGFGVATVSFASNNNVS